jgi:hypothetical protein
MKLVEIETPILDFSKLARSLAHTWEGLVPTGLILRGLCAQ